MLLSCPKCQSVDHLSKWIQYTAETLRIKIISAARHPIYVCPKCLTTSVSANLPRIYH